MDLCIILIVMAASSSYSPVHQLWPPPEGNQRTQLDVLFFHGLELTAEESSDAWRSTWTQRGRDDICWPQEWLPVDLGKAVRIFSISYNAHVATSPHGHVSGIADNLVQSLIKRYEWDHPIVLIGHSFGGLVLKSLVVELKLRLAIDNAPDLCSKVTVQRGEMFLSNVRGVVFYAVPHAGSVNFDEYVKNLLSCNRHYRGIMDNLKPWQQDMEKLSLAFNDIVIEKKIEIYAFCEGRPMEQVGILVEVGSAQRLARRNYYKVEDANHMEVCKPPFKEHLSYQLLLDFINRCQVSRELQEDHDMPHAMFGLEKYVEKVESLVISNDVDPQYVGVSGMGGVGKTLLLHNVYKSPRIFRHFQRARFIWLTVGRSPDIMALYRTLSAELGLQEEKTTNADDYKSKLLFHFKQKRVFLVLDDVWEDKTFNSLNLAKGEGSATLLSTRNLFIFERANPEISEVHMTPLLQKDSWSLFCVHAFKPRSNIVCEIEKLAQYMADKCKGFPLALKVLGKAMFGKNLQQWKAQLNKLRKSRMQQRSVKEELYEPLKIGYDILSEDDERLQRCFHYFAAFPEGCKIIFEEILCHWIGEGLVPAHNEEDPSEDAFSLLKKLWERSFIETDRALRTDIPYFLDFKVHDVMRDLAFYILEKDFGTSPAEQLYFYRAGQNLDVVPNDCSALLKSLRLSFDTNNLKTFPDCFNAPKLTSLLLGRNAIVSIPANFLSNLPKLKVLNLSEGKFHNLPEELGNLKHLVCLDLSDCHNLEILPDKVRQLHELKYLILDDCWSLKYLPSAIRELTSLQVLHIAHCSSLIWAEHMADCWDYPYPSVAASLDNLCELVERCCISTESKHMAECSTFAASLENICELVHLTELTIFTQEDGMMKNVEVKVPNNLSALANLKLLQVWLNSKTLPAKMAYRCLQLQHLDLWSSELESLPISFTSCGAFPSLIVLRLLFCKLVNFPEVEEGALPKLRNLDVSACSSLITLPFSINKLTTLRSIWVDKDRQKRLKNTCRTNWQFVSTVCGRLPVAKNRRYIFRDLRIEEMKTICPLLMAVKTAETTGVENDVSKRKFRKWKRQQIISTV